MEVPNIASMPTCKVKVPAATKESLVVSSGVVECPEQAEQGWGAGDELELADGQCRQCFPRHRRVQTELCQSMLRQCVETPASM